MACFRLLDPFNSQDCAQFESILDHYLEFEKNRQIKLYSYESIKIIVSWYRYAFYKFSQTDFVVCSKFENGELEKILIAYKLKLLLGEVLLGEDYNFTTNNILPYSYLALIYHKNKVWGNPEEDMNTLSTMASEHFESQGINKLLITVRLSRKILRTTDIEKFLNEEFIKTFPNSSKKYLLTLEAVFFNQGDLDRYNSSIYRILVPLNICKPVMLVAWYLKPKFVLNNYITANET